MGTRKTYYINVDAIHRMSNIDLDAHIRDLEGDPRRMRAGGEADAVDTALYHAKVLKYVRAIASRSSGDDTVPALRT